MRETPREQRGTSKVSISRMGVYLHAHEMATLHTDDRRPSPSAYMIFTLNFINFYPKNYSERGDSLWNLVSTNSEAPYASTYIIKMWPSYCFFKAAKGQKSKKKLHNKQFNS